MSEDVSASCTGGKERILWEGMVNGSSWQNVQGRKGLRRGMLVSWERPHVHTLRFCAHVPTLFLQTLGEWTWRSPIGPLPFIPYPRLLALQLPFWFLSVLK